jgi:hypothetical protein
MKGVSVREIRLNIPLEDLRRDTERYCAGGIELGATDSRAISVKNGKKMIFVIKDKTQSQFLCKLIFSAP